MVFCTNPIWTVNVSFLILCLHNPQVTNDSPNSPFLFSRFSHSQTRMTTRRQSLDEPNSEDKKRPSRPPTTFEIAYKILREEGVQGFYAGIKPALVLVLNPIIQYTVFEQLKSRLARTKKLGNLDFFLLGAISKLAATSITYPYM